MVELLPQLATMAREIPIPEMVRTVLVQLLDVLDFMLTPFRRLAVSFAGSPSKQELEPTGGDGARENSQGQGQQHDFDAPLPLRFPHLFRAFTAAGM
jgi:hypothetical protein